MPIIVRNNGAIEIFGKEYDILQILPEKIQNLEPITELIKQIDPEDLDKFLNLPLTSCITEDLSNSDCLTMVHVAAKYGNVNALKELALYGAKFDVYSVNYGLSPLHFAAHYNHPDTIEYLVKEQNMSVDTPTKLVDYFDNKEKTPLFDCAVHGSIAAAKKLISLGANTNYKSTDGNTALDYARFYGFMWNEDEVVYDFIELLLLNGADPSLQEKTEDYQLWILSELLRGKSERLIKVNQFIKDKTNSNLQDQAKDTQGVVKSIPILNALKNNSQITRFVPYMLDNTLQAENIFTGTEINIPGYKMEDFVADNKIVMEWFSQLQQEFNQWRSNQYTMPVTSVNLSATGSRSFNASYTESDLECAIVSENFDDFLDFCRFLNTKYSDGHTFIALKTLAGLPLLIIKSEAGFCCSELTKLYPGKTLPQLEVTFRHPGVHKIIQEAGTRFFAELKPEELESYVFNKRHIELMLRNGPKEATFEGKPLKNVLEEFKGALSAALKCLPSGVLQDTPAFNKEVFANTIKPKPTLSDAIASGITLYQQPDNPSNSTQPVSSFPYLF